MTKNTLRQLAEVPRPSAAMPAPCIVASEAALALLYVVASTDSGAETVAVVEFNRPLCHVFGPPNDEAQSAHPLADRGLRPYSAHEIEQSSWIGSMAGMYALTSEEAERWARWRHFVFTFHDSTFECAAASFEVRLAVGSIGQLVRDVAARMAE